MHAFALAAGTTARLHVVSEALTGGFPHFVIIAPPGRDATPATYAAFLSEPGGLAALLTHDAGLAWTDQAGEALLAETLARGGIAVMGFVNLADAMAACRRVRGLVA